MTYSEFESNQATYRNKSLRKGQSLMIYLWEVWRDEYNRITSLDYYDETDIDCFYNDDLIPNTLEHLKKVWYKYPN